MRPLKIYYFLLGALLVFGCKETEVVPIKTVDLLPNEHLPLGNPSQATADPVNAITFCCKNPSTAHPTAGTGVYATG